VAALATKSSASRKPDYFRRAAIANAIEDAVGVRVRDLPITAEKVYGTAASVIAPKLNLVCEDFLLREVM
jgi:hypothetical protein